MPGGDRDRLGTHGQAPVIIVAGVYTRLPANVDICILQGQANLR
ncbi:hypothetical protein CSB93_5086 [Pseudomonas paraeruginosa]|uniref:Uncharacterized protein n=1 Tax=Pseudomonas paraeruginosa TaxID=2994495 RepID=A0A2R3J3W1_9PSED|nr:hypothetical protein CSB93_5086 [Pseudomonas paraeruginosa]AWE90558.1 hypothetical protein CSC28_3877 [Pseudomonas paraeruginosa]